MNRPEIVKQIQHTLRQNSPEVTAILYGSEARGDARADSDIDLLILIDGEKVSNEERKRLTYPLYDIEFKTGVIVSPKVFTKNNWHKKHSITPFYHNVMKEGKQIC